MMAVEAMPTPAAVKPLAKREADLAKQPRSERASGSGPITDIANSFAGGIQGCNSIRK